MLYPVTHFVCEMLPEQMRESTRTELFFDDLEKLPSMEVARICEWLTEKVDGFSSKTRAEPKDAEEEVRCCSALACSTSTFHFFIGRTCNVLLLQRCVDTCIFRVCHVVSCNINGHLLEFSSNVETSHWFQVWPAAGPGQQVLIVVPRELSLQLPHRTANRIFAPHFWQSALSFHMQLW